MLRSIIFAFYRKNRRMKNKKQENRNKKVQ